MPNDDCRVLWGARAALVVRKDAPAVIDALVQDSMKILTTRVDQSSEDEESHPNYYKECFDARSDVNGGKEKKDEQEEAA